MVEKKFWRTNIPDPMFYIQCLRDQVREIEGNELTAERLKEAIEEDSYEPISVEECQRLPDVSNLLRWAFLNSSRTVV